MTLRKKIREKILSACGLALQVDLQKLRGEVSAARQCHNRVAGIIRREEREKAKAVIKRCYHLTFSRETNRQFGLYIAFDPNMFCRAYCNDIEREYLADFICQDVREKIMSAEFVVDANEQQAAMARRTRRKGILG